MRALTLADPSQLERIREVATMELGYCLAAIGGAWSALALALTWLVRR